MIASTVQFLKNNRCGLLLVALLLYLVVDPFRRDGGTGHFLFNALGTAVIFSAVYAAASRTRHLAISAILAFVALAGTWISQVIDTAAAWIFADLAIVALYLFIAVIMLGYVLRDGNVTADKLFAAICVYFFIAIIFARAYHAIEISSPGSFANVSQDRASATDDLTYFSFVTITTLGYGDITPKSPEARCFAMLEASAGVLYLAILISRLASLYRREHDPS